MMTNSCCSFLPATQIKQFLELFEFRSSRNCLLELVVQLRILLMEQRVILTFQDCINPSSAVRREAVLIVRGLGNLDPGFLHYIFDCILNDPALLWQKQTQSLQQFSHQPLGACHRS